MKLDLYQADFIIQYKYRKSNKTKWSLYFYNSMLIKHRFWKMGLKKQNKQNTTGEVIHVLMTGHYKEPSLYAII